MFSPTAEQRAALADQLHAYADAIAAGRVPLPALRYQELDGDRLRVVPRLLHDLLCDARVATPQTGTDPVVLHCEQAHAEAVDRADQARVELHQARALAGELSDRLSTVHNLLSPLGLNIPVTDEDDE